MTDAPDNPHSDPKDRRKLPRIAFHLPVSVMGLNEKARIIDFSLGGFFVQMESGSRLKEGQLIRVALRFPHEKKISIIKAKIVRLEKSGFGCQFMELDPIVQELLKTNFDIFSGTLPIG